MVKTSKFTGLKVRGEEMNIIKHRRKYIFISIAIILAGLIMFFVNGLNYGIDFTGGTLIQIKAGKFIPVEEIRKTTDEFDKNASIVHGGANKEDIIIRSTLDLSNEDTNRIITSFESNYGVDRKNAQSEKFGAFMGKEIRNKAVISILIASVAMLIYITFRFEFKFGVAAIIALIHDVLVTIAIYAIFKLPVNSSFIAAILTIVGYSINDTIVIFDRIREERKLNPKESIENIINGSITRTMRRTINTTVTTVLAVVVLYIVGVDDVKVLALPLILGMIAGTYSSIFIAAPLWYDLTKIKTAK